MLWHSFAATCLVLLLDGSVGGRVRLSPGGYARYDAKLEHSTGVFDYDVIVYGATPAGFAAAIGAATSFSGTDKRVLLLEPSGYVGGMAGPGGIGLRDIGNINVLNSTELQWAMLNGAHYGVDYGVWDPDSWVGNHSFWTMLDQHKSVLDVVLNERVMEWGDGVTVSSKTITELHTAGPSGSGADIKTFRADYFVDASYEGDVMRFSGASFTYGRESSAKYNESYAGVISGSTNTFKEPVPATWSNGTLLNWVQDLPDPRTLVGAADDNVMAYSFRLCLTTRTDNQVNVTAPQGYSTEAFELSRRYVKQLLATEKSLYTPWNPIAYRSYPPGDKVDACCGNGPVGIDAAGLARGYSNGSYAEREVIKQQHMFYVQGLAYFWMFDPNSGVPEETQREMRKYGLCKDEWPENNHYPPQLYVREAARMVGDKVYTQNDRLYSGSAAGCRDDSIGVGSWGFDIHQMERVAVASVSGASGSGPYAYNEGLTSPGQGDNIAFDLPYWLLLPKRAEINNLLVPNCPSISHVAFAAVREEPTLWQMGQAAGTAAAIAASSTVQPVVLQDLDVDSLIEVLHQRGILNHFPMRSNCSAPVPPPPVPCSAYSVIGAGTVGCNGLYTRQGDDLLWQHGDDHSIQLKGSAWHVASLNGSIVYYATSDGIVTAPPSAAWKPSQGAAPAPELKCADQTPLPERE